MKDNLSLIHPPFLSRLPTLNLLETRSGRSTSYCSQATINQLPCIIGISDALLGCIYGISKKIN